jgi:hypothetical protein
MSRFEYWELSSVSTNIAVVILIHCEGVNSQYSMRLTTESRSTICFFFKVLPEVSFVVSRGFTNGLLHVS